MNDKIQGELLQQAKGCSESATIASIVKDHIKVRTITVKTKAGDCEVLAVPHGIELQGVKEFVDEYALAPERRVGTAQHTELQSFIAHVKRFSDPDSALFADRTPTAPSLVCVLDYHRKNGEPRFGQHRAHYAFPLSDAWKAWTEAAGKPMDQAKFASFLEDRIADTLDPIEASNLESTKKAMEALLCKFASPATLMDLARGLAVRVESMVANAQNLKSGESTIRFDTQHTDERGAPLDVPGAFLVGLQIFRGGERYAIAARLRYRVKEGRLTWHFDLYRAVEAFDLAFGEACSRAATETDLPLFHGRPE